MPDCVKTPGAQKLAAALGFFALSARSAGFIFLANPIGITGGLIYGACAYATDKLFKSVFKVSILDDKKWEKQKVVIGAIQCLATAVIAKLAIIGLLAVQLSLGASILIPFTSAIAVGAGAYWVASGLVIATCWTATAAATGFCALVKLPSLGEYLKEASSDLVNRISEKFSSIAESMIEGMVLGSSSRGSDFNSGNGRVVDGAGLSGL